MLILSLILTYIIFSHVNFWNSLPADIVNSSTVHFFNIPDLCAWRGVNYIAPDVALFDNGWSRLWEQKVQHSKNPRMNGEECLGKKGRLQPIVITCVCSWKGGRWQKDHKLSGEVCQDGAQWVSWFQPSKTLTGSGKLKGVMYEKWKKKLNSNLRLYEIDSWHLFTFGRSCWPSSYSFFLIVQGWTLFLVLIRFFTLN